jgi:hypothetical protein
LAQGECLRYRAESLSAAITDFNRSKITKGDPLMGIVMCIVTILAIAALIKYLLNDSGKK